MGSNLAQQAVQACHDLPPALDIIDDGLVAPSAMRLHEEDYHFTGPFSEEKEASMSELVADGDGCLEIQELSIDGQVVEASKKLDPTIRKAFWLAIDMHTCIVRAFLFDTDRADPRATAKRLSPLQKLLVSLRRQVVQGIDKLLVPIKLLELDIINHILIQLLPAGIPEVEGSPVPQTTVPFTVTDSDTAIGFNHDKSKITEVCELDGGFAKTTLSSQGHEQVICLNPGAPVEMESGFDGGITTGACSNHGDHFAEDDIDSESSFEMVDAIDAVSDASTDEFSLEVINIAELSAFEVCI